MTKARKGDIDPLETEEWIDSLRAVIEREGPGRAHFLLEKLVDYTQALWRLFTI